MSVIIAALLLLKVVCVVSCLTQRKIFVLSFFLFCLFFFFFFLSFIFGFFFKGGDESTPECVPITEREVVRRDAGVCYQSIFNPNLYSRIVPISPSGWITISSFTNSSSCSANKISDFSTALGRCLYNGGSTSPGGNGRSFIVEQISSAASLASSLMLLAVALALFWLPNWQIKEQHFFLKISRLWDELELFNILGLWGWLEAFPFDTHRTAQTPCRGATKSCKYQRTRSRTRKREQLPPPAQRHRCCSWKQNDSETEQTTTTEKQIPNEFCFPIGRAISNEANKSCWTVQRNSRQHVVNHIRNLRITVKEQQKANDRVEKGQSVIRSKQNRTKYSVDCRPRNSNNNLFTNQKWAKSFSPGLPSLTFSRWPQRLA